MRWSAPLAGEERGKTAPFEAAPDSLNPNEMGGNAFEWDPRKGSANRRKHGVGFAEAGTVFDDRFRSRSHTRIMP